MASGRKKQLKSKRKIRPYTSARRSLAAKLGWKRRRSASPSLAKAHRSIVAKKSARVRKRKAALAFKGINLERSWEGKSRDGGPTGYHYERYTLDILDVGTVQNIIDEVKRKNPDRPFFVGGQIDFRDADERLFTNNAEFSTYLDKNAPQKIIEGLQYTSLHNSNPFQTGKSTQIDVEGYYVLIRFQRTRLHPSSGPTQGSGRANGKSARRQRKSKRRKSARK